MILVRVSFNVFARRTSFLLDWFISNSLQEKCYLCDNNNTSLVPFYFNAPLFKERASISGVQGGWKSGEIKLQKSSSSNDSNNNNSSNSQSARNPPIRGQPVGDEALNDPIYDPEMRCKAIKVGEFSWKKLFVTFLCTD